jgi:hypothetical protein
MTQDNPKADGQSPAEVLDNILRDYAGGLFADSHPQALKTAKAELTAYAARVEREVIEAYSKVFTQLMDSVTPVQIGKEVFWNTSVVYKARDGAKTIVANRLAALQGPQDGDAE